MLKKVLLVAALVAKLSGIAMIYQSTIVAADDCPSCPEPECWPGQACNS